MDYRFTAVPGGNGRHFGPVEGTEGGDFDRVIPVGGVHLDETLRAAASVALTARTVNIDFNETPYTFRGTEFPKGTTEDSAVAGILAIDDSLLITVVKNGRVRRMSHHKPVIWPPEV